MGGILAKELPNTQQVEKIKRNRSKKIKAQYKQRSYYLS